MTKEEYIRINEANYETNYFIQKYSERKYQCPRCKIGGMRKNLQVICASYPPKFEYKCDSCGYVDYLDF